MNAVAFAPDGRHLVSGGGDSTARIWALAGSAKPVVLRATQVGGVYSAVYSDDGRHLVTAADDGTVRVWTGAGQAVTTLRGHEGAVHDAVFDPSGRRVASVGADDSVRVWDWAHTLPTAETIDPEGFPYNGGATFAPDGRSVLSIDLARLPQHLGHVCGAPDSEGRHATSRKGSSSRAAVSPDGSRFAVSRPDGVIEVRPTSGAGRPTLLRGHRAGVLGLSFSADGGRLASAGERRQPARVGPPERLGSRAAQGRELPLRRRPQRRRRSCGGRSARRASCTSTTWRPATSWRSCTATTGPGRRSTSAPTAAGS